MRNMGLLYLISSVFIPFGGFCFTGFLLHGYKGMNFVVISLILCFWMMCGALLFVRGIECYRTALRPPVPEENISVRHEIRKFMSYVVALRIPAYCLSSFAGFLFLNTKIIKHGAWKGDGLVICAIFQT